ncbi:MAG: insulinase family protein [Verrucomicrobiae bacterium]|nr:insulinase family protein [Verrucomicrobiae bacterium]
MAGVSPVEKVVLGNGLTVLVREDHSAPVVSVQAWCRAGSITEGAWMGAGLSHVLEHMLFKGTTTRGVAQIAQQVEDKGGYINAYTSFEHTVYYINIPSENWRTALDILVDCMMNATIPEAELRKEKEVILREMAMNVDDPVRRSNRLLWATAYTTHPYRHPVIGYPDIFNRITRDDVVAYYRKFYVPNNLVFAVVGNISASAVVSHLRELTKDFRMGAIEPVVVPAEPPQLSLRERHESAPVKLSRLHLAWHIPSVTHPDVYALDVLAVIAGQGRSSRLYREIRQQKGLVHTINCSAYTPAHPGLFVIEATCDHDKRAVATAAIRELMGRFAAEPVGEAELQKAIKSLLADHLGKLKTMEGQASDMAHNFVLTGDPNFGEVYLERVRAVRAEDIRRVAQRYMTSNNLTITSLNPVVAGAKQEGAGVAPRIRVEKFELPNGLRLLVREDPKVPLVDVRALFKGGVLVETPDNNGITKLTARMLLKGTKTRTADEVSEAIESVGGSISYFSGNNSFGVSTHTMSDDLDLALDVLADVLQNPTFPAELLERERKVQLAEIKAEQDQIVRVGQQLLREAIFPAHPYRLNQLGTVESVSKLTVADLVGFHRRYVVPNNMVLAVFGKVSAGDVRRKVEQRFGAMEKRALEFPKTTADRIRSEVRRESLQPKEQAVLLIGYNGASLFDEDRFALDLLDEIYSGMGSRIFLRLRDELGLCYYCGAFQLVGPDPGCFALYVGTAPDRVAECEKELLAEVERLQREGVTEAELERAKNSVIGQRKVRMQDNAELAMTVGLDELYGLGHEFFLSGREVSRSHARGCQANRRQTLRRPCPRRHPRQTDSKEVICRNGVSGGILLVRI